jgi:hypothetical protein
MRATRNGMLEIVEVRELFTLIASSNRPLHRCLVTVPAYRAKELARARCLGPETPKLPLIAIRYAHEVHEPRIIYG